MGRNTGWRNYFFEHVHFKNILKITIENIKKQILFSYCVLSMIYDCVFSSHLMIKIINLFPLLHQSEETTGPPQGSKILKYSLLIKILQIRKISTEIIGKWSYHREGSQSILQLRFTCLKSHFELLLSLVLAISCFLVTILYFRLSLKYFSSCFQMIYFLLQLDIAIKMLYIFYFSVHMDNIQIDIPPFHSLQFYVKGGRVVTRNDIFFPSRLRLTISPEEINTKGLGFFLCVVPHLLFSFHGANNHLAS